LVEATTTEAGCGCCRPEPKTTQDLISELRARRDDLDARLGRLESRREPVAAR
jgi:hypothetical protein